MNNEPAVDMGGVTKEYFSLLFKEILKPNRNLFEENADTGTIWFHDTSKYSNIKILEHIGIICGLAIFNNNTVNLPFPLVLYKVNEHLFS